jgi:type IV secretion system protein VirB9
MSRWRQSRAFAVWAALAMALGYCGVGGPAHAVQTPRPGPADPRIKTIDYNPQQVVRIVGVFRTATQIILAPEETIEHVALGDSSGWEVAAQANTIFVKPTLARAPTNLIVTTQAGRESRNYAFELSTRAGPTSRNAPDTFFVVRFVYPDHHHAEVTAAITAQAAALEQKIIQLKLDRGVLQGPRNLAYALRGSTAIAPSEVSDNGRFTVMRFPAAQAVPAIFAVAPDGAETLVPFDVRGEFVVVHLTAAMLRLRRGQEVVCVINQAARRYGDNLGTGTAAPDVDRTLKAEPNP